MRVQAQDPTYVAQARAEAQFWTNGPRWADAAAETANIIARRHYNLRFTGDPHLPWFETIARYGPFHSGAVLGAGGIPHEKRILETNPSLRLTIFDISPGPLAERDRALAPLFPGRVQTQRADLNFIQLPADAYDVIISASAIHHVTNLEYLAEQVRRALMPGGYFFLHDYVGESRRRFSPLKKLVFELLYNREMTRQGRLPVELEWSTGDDVTSPFCAIRSADILPVFGERLAVQQLRTTGALVFPMLFSRDPRPPARASLRWRLSTTRGLRKIMRVINTRVSSAVDDLVSPAFLVQLLDIGDRLADAGEILPTNAFAIYRRQ
jgi:SAM-dependent methyltransferase